MDRLTIFSLAFGIAYVCAYYFSVQLFEYYPLSGDLRFAWDNDPTQQTIRWYGWLATAALAGLIAALILPRRLTARISPDLLWVVLVVLVVAVFMYERRWFL
jgi:hypothetical protein